MKIKIYLLISFLLTGFSAAYGAPRRIDARFVLDKTNVAAPDALKLTLELAEDLKEPESDFNIYFYIKAVGAPHGAAGFFTATSGASGYHLSDTGLIEVPLKKVSDRTLEVTDLRVNKWLPAGPYVIDHVTVLTAKIGSRGYRETLATIASPWFDKTGNPIPGIAPAFVLSGTDPDGVNPVIDGVSIDTARTASDLPVIKRGDTADVVLQYEDDKSGLGVVSGVMSKVVRVGDKYKLDWPMRHMLDFRCSYDSIPLKGTVRCPLKNTGKMETGLYALHLLMVSDHRAWGLDNALIWVAPMMERGPKLVETNVLLGTQLGATKGAKIDNATTRYWLGHGHRLELKLPVLQID